MSKKKPAGAEFARWISDKIFYYGIQVYPMADELHIAPRTIYHHMNGEHNPSFPIVVSYCWYLNKHFGDMNDPVEIWALVEYGGQI